MSEREKRELEKFPSFSLEALLDSSYFSQIGLWFSDTFTGRDAWIAAGQELESLYGWSDVVIYGDLSAGDAIPPLDSTATPAPSPETTPVPEAENQEETTAPTATPQPTPEPYVWGGENLEDEELVTLGAVIQIGDSAYTFTGFSQYYSDAYAANITKAADLLEGKCRVFNLLVLHGTTLMLPREYREEIGCAPEEDILDYVNSKLGDNVYAVDTYDPLLWHNDEYIYFRTDHHWTALGAWYAYEEWAKMAGFEPVGLEPTRRWCWNPSMGACTTRQTRAILCWRTQCTPMSRRGTCICTWRPITGTPSPTGGLSRMWSPGSSEGTSICASWRETIPCAPL